MSLVEFEAANIVAPLENSSAMKSQANLAVSNASGLSFGMSGLFGASWGDGHYYTLSAQGAQILVKFAPNESTCIDGFATGTDSKVAFPIADGAMVSVRIPPGRETATGVATMVNYGYLHARVVSGGVASGYLRVWRSSLDPRHDAGFFRAP